MIVVYLIWLIIKYSIVGEILLKFLNYFNKYNTFKVTKNIPFIEAVI